MTGELFLLTVARLGLVLAGFTGIVSILLPRGVNHWTKQEVKGLKLMLEFDLAAMFFALLPFPIYYTVGSSHEHLLWRISSFLLAGYLGWALWTYGRGLKQPNTPPRHPKLYRWLLIYPLVFFLGLEICGVILWPALAPYAWGVFWLLIPPVIQFIIYIFHFQSKIEVSTADRSMGRHGGSDLSLDKGGGNIP